MDLIASGIKDADWRGPWILVIFKNPDFKKRFIQSKIEILFQDGITFDGSVSDLISDSDSDPIKVMLNIIEPFIADMNDIVLKPIKLSIYENQSKHEVPVSLICSKIVN